MYMHGNGEDEEEFGEDDFIRPIQNRLDQTQMKLFCNVSILHHYHLHLDGRISVLSIQRIHCELFCELSRTALKQQVSSVKNACRLDVIVSCM